MMVTGLRLQTALLVAAILNPGPSFTEGHGTILMRTDGDGADYKKVTVREIDPGTTSVLTKYTVVNKNRLELKVFSKEEYNLLGRVLGKALKSTSER
jgi:hypothetical protein